MDREVGHLRRTGIECTGDMPWGTHFCQFYDTAQDLLDILVPYFKAGLEQNEFCMWVTSEPLNHKEAERALRAAMPDFGNYVERNAIEIIPHTEWYTPGGVFDKTRVLDGWVHKLENALSRGFEGLRLTGNTFWLESSQWRDFYDYEATVNSVIGRYRMIAACTYSVNMCGAGEIIDVVQNHQFSLVKRGGRWTVIRGSEMTGGGNLQSVNRQLQQRTLDLETAVQELQSFSYSVSHDLRSPLRAIDGYARLLQAHLAGNLDQEGQRLVNVIRDNTSRMGKIIDDILDFSRLGRIDLHSEPLEMTALARGAWEEVAEGFGGRQVAMTIGELPATAGDRLMLRQVFINLLSNAVKATRNQPDARIEVGGRTSGDEHVYYVKDNGMGYDARFQERLFSLFQRLHDVEEFPGSGVGLAIVKRIVTRHGGRVWSEGKVGEGAIFWFALPKEAAHG